MRYFADFERVLLTERTTEHGEVLRKQENRSAVDQTATGHHAITRVLRTTPPHHTPHKVEI